MPIPQDITDQELISMCIQGKDAGYTGLYQKYARRIYNSISRLIVHTAEAEDILQETFFNAFSDPERLRGILSFEAWVRRMAVNKAISHLRGKKIQFADMGEMDPQAEEEYDMGEDELFNCKVEDVKKSIDALATGYKTILNLYLFEKMSQDEIAGVLGLSHATVRTQYHRAKKRILLALKDKAYYE